MFVYIGFLSRENRKVVLISSWHGLLLSESNIDASTISSLIRWVSLSQTTSWVIDVQIEIIRKFKELLYERKEYQYYHGILVLRNYVCLTRHHLHRLTVSSFPIYLSIMDSAIYIVSTSLGYPSMALHHTCSRTYDPCTRIIRVSSWSYILVPLGTMW